MMNFIFAAMIIGAVIFGALLGRLDEVSKSVTDSAGKAVTLVIGLIGVMTLFLGLMQVLQKGGLLRSVARGLRPILVRLFPDVPPEHPAMGMMIMNMTANMLGLANAATPFGIKAMLELDKLNSQKGTASNAMALFLAINTSNLALIPSGIIGVRASLGSQAPGSIVVTTLIATTISTIMAIIAAKSLQRLRIFNPPVLSQASENQVKSAPSISVPDTASAEAAVDYQAPAPKPVVRLLGYSLALLTLGGLIFAVWSKSQSVTDAGQLGFGGALKFALEQWPLLLIVVAIVLYGIIRGVSVYDCVVEGGKEGFQVAIRITPFLVAILAAIGMLQASGGLDLLVRGLSPAASLIGIPPETLPMALMRPLSGSGALGVAAETMRNYGPDSLIGQIVSTMQGSSETTFYIIALYFGAIGIRRTRHTVPACLIGDTCGLVASAWLCLWLLG